MYLLMWVIMICLAAIPRVRETMGNPDPVQVAILCALVIILVALWPILDRLTTIARRLR